MTSPNQETRKFKPPKSNFASNLLEALDLTTEISTQPTTECPVLVAVDFENTQFFNEDNPGPPNTQVGLAILDTAQLGMETIPGTIISSYNFVVGPLEYYRKAERVFLFGEPVLIDSADILHHIQASIPQNRRVILVGHDIENETCILRKLGFGFQSIGVIAFIDTARLAAQILPCFSLQPGKIPSLRSLLIRLYCPYKGLHNGGNNANFTLRALLLLAVKACSDQEERSDRLRVLEQIAKASISLRSPEEETRSIARRSLKAERKASNKPQPSGCKRSAKNRSINKRERFGRKEQQKKQYVKDHRSRSSMILV